MKWMKKKNECSSQSLKLNFISSEGMTADRLTCCVQSVWPLENGAAALDGSVLVCRHRREIAYEANAAIVVYPCGRLLIRLTDEPHIIK